MKRLLIACAVAALAASASLSTTAFAAPVPAEQQQENRTRPIPFRGKIAAVDKQAKTITVGERVFQIMADTRINKAGKPATLDDASVGEEIAGAYRQGADKTLQAVSVRIGPRPQPAQKNDEKKETK